jgi:hypothetical protein
MSGPISGLCEIGAQFDATLAEVLAYRTGSTAQSLA